MSTSTSSVDLSKAFVSLLFSCSNEFPEFVESLLKGREKLVYVSWVKKRRGSKEEKRLVVVTEFRLFSCKKHKITQTRTVSVTTIFSNVSFF